MAIKKTKRRNQREREKSARCLSTNNPPPIRTHNISSSSFSTESHHPPYRQVHLVSLLLLHSNIRHSQREGDTPWEKPCLGGGGRGGKLLSPTTRLAGSRAALQAILTLWQPAIHIPSIFCFLLQCRHKFTVYRHDCEEVREKRERERYNEMGGQDYLTGALNKKILLPNYALKIARLFWELLFIFIFLLVRGSDVQYIYTCIYCLCAPHIPRAVIDCDGCPGLSRCGDWWRHDARQPRPAAVGVHCTVPTICNFIFSFFCLGHSFFFFFFHFNSRMSIFV